jgi:alcohol dehydrogenase (cytochrome c)
MKLLQGRSHAARWLAVVAASMLVSVGWAADEGGANTNWLSYNGSADGQRYSTLDQITPKNAASLSEVCRVKVADSGSFHTGILEIDGTLYFTTPHDTLAVDAKTCAVRWRNTYVPEEAEVFAVNRGVAYSNGRLYRGTPDARLLAIDATTGKTLWKEQVGDPKLGEFVSSVPVVWEGMIITATAGGDWGIRGRVMALDEATGRELWRFHTIPMGTEKGADSWKDARAAHRGGGGSWTTFTVDYANGDLYVPVGNPAPDFTPIPRPGANLFTDSVVVLDIRTGALKWWFQMAAHDSHDVDLGAAPMLYWSNKANPMAAVGSKDGYLYGVNRETHKVMYRTRTTTIVNEGVPITDKGLHVCPGPMGGTEWNGPAMDVKNKAVLVEAVDWCSLITSKPTEWAPGQFFVAGSWKMDPKATGWILAVDPDNGQTRWRYHADGAVVSGLTPTAGGVTFGGDMTGNFLVLDSATGKELVKTPTGGALAGGVITYERDGQQYVAVASGNVSRLTFGVSGSPTLIVYGLNGKGGSAATSSSGGAPAGPPDAAHGKTLYAQTCAGCHGASAEGGAGPALTGLNKRMNLEQTIKWLKNPDPPMPKLYPSPLDEQAVTDIAAYVQGL